MVAAGGRAVEARVSAVKMRSVHNAHSARSAAIAFVDVWETGESSFAAALFGERNGFAAAFRADFDFVDDEDFVSGERGDERPEDRDRGAENGDVDFEHREDVDGRCGEGRVEDGDCANAADAEGDHAGDCKRYNTGRVVSQIEDAEIV